MMANAYKSYYAEDLKAMINEAALNTLLVPVFDARTIETTPEELPHHNELIAFYNDGVRNLAEELKIMLTMDEPKDEE